MPVAHIYVTASSAEQVRQLLVEGSRRYADVLGAPIERVRIFVHDLPPARVAVGGVPLEAANGSPFFEAMVLRGRTVEQRHRLLAVLTDVCVEVLGVPRDRVRGMITEIDADNWGIAGVPAARARADEIAGRMT